jgi:hypothetical protein
MIKGSIKTFIFKQKYEIGYSNLNVMVETSAQPIFTGFVLACLFGVF